MIMDETLKLLIRQKEAASLHLRLSLRDFIAVFHFYLTRQNFTFKKFHLDLIAELENIVFKPDQEKPNLYIGMPPRFGKTQISKYFVAWCFAVNPQSNFILTSYGSDLVLSSSKVIRETIKSELFRLLFSLKVDTSSSGADLWQISGGGSFRAATIEGVVTGFGAGTTSPGFGGALIIDDFLKANESHSTAAKKAVISSYTDALKSRLNKPGTPIIIIAQRLAVDDLIGYIEENERDKWKFYLIEGLNEETGLAAWEEKMPAATLQEMKIKTPAVFYSQYQQTPIILGGDVFKSEWWQFYDTRQKFNYRRIFIVGDTALKTGQHNDFTCLMVIGVMTNGTIHLLDMVHGKLEAPDLETVFVNLWNKWRQGVNGCRTSAVYIEDKASGIGLIQSIKRRGVPVVAMTPTKDKYSRALEATPTIQAGLFHLPNSATDPISQKVISETESFRADMSHKHDDITDTVCYAIEKAASGGGFF